MFPRSPAFYPLCGTFRGDHPPGQSGRAQKTRASVREAVLAELPVEAALADPQDPGGPAPVAARGAQRTVDVLALHLLQRRQPLFRIPGRRGGSSASRAERRAAGARAESPSPSHTTTAASMACWSSRTLPGHSCAHGGPRRPASPASCATRSARSGRATKCSASRATSSGRSRSGGTSTVIVLSR